MVPAEWFSPRWPGKEFQTPSLYCRTTAAGGTGPCLMLHLTDHTWSNWAGNYSCKAENYFEPGNENEIREIVLRARKEGKRIRVAGSGHSFSPIAMSNDFLVS